MAEGRYDVAVIGSGPNGLAAAVTMARAGLEVRVFERAETPGGGARTVEMGTPGFRHDVCSAVHPMALASPFFRAFGLDQRINFHVPEISYAQPLDGGRAAVAYRDLNRTVEELGADGSPWRRLFEPMLRRLDALVELTGGSMLRVPADPVAAAILGARVLEQGSPAWGLRFRGDQAPALLGGVSAHAPTRQPGVVPAGVGLLLAAHAHARGWPVPIGGSQSVADALIADLQAHGGTVECGRDIQDLVELGQARAVLFDTSAATLVRVAGARLRPGYRRRALAQRTGPGVAKVDFELSAPVPWTNPQVARSGTVHVGGTRAQVAQAEADVVAGRHSPAPFVLASQPSLFDTSRAPEGCAVLWTYCHVPAGSNVDMEEAITRQIERFAPGFRDVITATHSRTAKDVGEYNPNYIGGDINIGALTPLQLVRRPVISPTPWRAGRGIYLCSSATPPATGVHGMCGWWAARTALRDVFGLAAPDLSPANPTAGPAKDS